jgi:hypothetical protein
MLIWVVEFISYHLWLKRDLNSGFQLGEGITEAVF